MTSILITGGSSGIGEALALHYAAPGVALVLTGRNAERLDAVAQACREKGASVETHAVDVTDRAALADAIIQTDSANPITLVIANAGISGGTGGKQEGESADQARRIFNINVTGVLNTLDPLIPRMAARAKGQIAIMSSLASFRGWPGAPAYSASKAAVRVYGEALRGALFQTGIKVSVICPGFVESRMTAANGFSMPFLMSAERAASIIASGLARNRARIAFPLPTYAGVLAMSLLPGGWVEAVQRRLPAKPAAAPSA